MPESPCWPAVLVLITSRKIYRLPVTLFAGCSLSFGNEIASHVPVRLAKSGKGNDLVQGAMDEPMQVGL
jgi:hypothetical protein